MKEIPLDELLQSIQDYLVPWTDAENKYFYLLTEIFYFNKPQSRETISGCILKIYYLLYRGTA